MESLNNIDNSPFATALENRNSLECAGAGKHSWCLQGGGSLPHLHWSKVSNGGSDVGDYHYAVGDGPPGEGGSSWSHLVVVNITGVIMVVDVSHYTHVQSSYDKHLKSLSEQFASMTKHSESLRWPHPFSSQTCIRFKTLRIPWATSTLCLDLVWTSAQKPRTISPVGGPCSWSGIMLIADTDDDYLLIFSCLKKKKIQSLKIELLQVQETTCHPWQVFEADWNYRWVRP